MANISGWLEKISKHEAWEIAKPWVTTYGLKYGVKSLHDVPEYFREKLELKGLKIGSKEFAGGLSGATADLLEKNRATIDSESTTNRGDVYRQLTELENAGKTDSEAYKKLTLLLEETRSTKVRDAIEKVNKKLSLTKEGTEKGSEARKEMARILREQRKAKSTNRENLKHEINTYLDDYTSQKVDGVTATREALRTALTISGQRYLMGLGHVLLDGASFVQNASQTARREGQEVSATFLKEQFVETARQQWAELRSSLTAQNEDRMMSVGESVAQLESQASKYVNTGAMRDVSRVAIPIISNAKVLYGKIAKPTKKASGTPTTPTSYNFSDTTAPTVTPQSQPVEPQEKSSSGTPAANDPARGTPGARRSGFSVSNGSSSEQNQPPLRKKEPLAEAGKTPDRSVSKSDERITSADRSGLSKPNYNVSTAWQSDNSNTSDLGRSTIDEAATGRYEQAGISGEYNQNRYGARAKNVQVERRQQAAEASVGAVPRGNVSVEPQNKNEMVGLNRRVQTVNRQRRRSFVGRQYTKAKKRAKKKGTAKNLLLRARASTVNMSIMSWLIPSYLAIQLPLALLNIVFFGIAAATIAASDAVVDAAGAVGDAVGDTVFGKVIQFVAGVAESTFSTLNEAVATVTGVDIGGLIGGLVEVASDAFQAAVELPQNIYMATLGLLLFYALAVLFTMGLLYMFNRLNPLFGSGSTSKIATFLGCLLGYILPFFNLFPWAVFWAAAVWKNPK